MLKFWEILQKRIGFESEKTLFIDDTLAILRTASKFGIRHLLYKAYASSRAERGNSLEFPSLDDFRDLIPRPH
jgi:putative hydrolase of the HAD superfamily